MFGMNRLKALDFKQISTLAREQVVKLASVLIDTARMQELWMRRGMRGFCIGAALWPLLLIHGVSGSVRVCDGQNRALGFAQPLAEGFDYCSGITANG